MKKILLILSILFIVSCNKKKMIIHIGTSYEAGYPNIYIENAKLFDKDKDLGEIFILRDGEIKSSGMFIIPSGEYTVKWETFTKNGRGDKLDKSDKSDKILVTEIDSLNEFIILGDKLYDKDGYKLHLEAISEANAIIEKMETDSIYINKRTDEMTDKTSYQASRHLNLSEQKNSAKIYIAIKKKNNKLVQDNLCIQMNIGGGCVENNKIIIMFSNGKKMSLTCWNDFNCDGNAWFNLSNEQCKLLSSERVDKIRIINGRSYDELNATLSINKDFFIQTFYAMNNNKIKTTN